MEPASNSSFQGQSIITSKATLGLSAASLFSYLAFKYYKKKNRDGLCEAEEELQDQARKIQQHQQEYQGVLGVFDYGPNEDSRHFPYALRKYFQPVGLDNIGNTCYMNALLQALTGCNQFMKYVKKLWNNIGVKQDDSDSIITFQLLSTLLDMSKGAKEASPRDIHDLLCQEFTSLFEQQDSHELLVYLLEKITKITAQHLRNLTFDEGLASPEIMTSTASESPREHEQDLLDTQVSTFSTRSLSSSKHFKGLLMVKELAANKKIGINPFAGVYMSTIQCLRCGPVMELHRQEVFYDISLELSPTLQSSLAEHFKSELIDDYLCIKCSLRTYLARFPLKIEDINDPEQREAVEFLTKMYNTHDLDEENFVKEWNQFKQESGNTSKHQIDKLQSQIRKQWSIQTAPKILGVHLKRLNYDMNGNLRLNQAFMHYPEVLDLSQIKTSQDKGPLFEAKYQLSAVIEHFGSAFGGHYVAYKKLFPEQQSEKKGLWVVADDKNIHIIEQKDALNRCAYMLFYEKISSS